MNNLQPPSSNVVIALVKATDAGGTADTGLAYNTTGLTITVIDTARTVKQFTGSNLETIANIASPSTPSAGKAGFVELGYGWYMVTIAAAVSGGAGTVNPGIAVIDVSGITDVYFNVGSVQTAAVAAELTATGLDNISAATPSAKATTIATMIVQLYRRFFGKATRNRSTNQLITYRDDGSTAATTQTVTDDGTTETQGEAS